MKIGYIGLGLMGMPMAHNLLKAGYEVVVYNRSRAKMDTLVQEGAVAAFSPHEVASRCDVVFTNLPDSPDVEQVVLGENGLIHAQKAGLVIIDNSTIKPETARYIAERLAEVGQFFLDAPVSGGDVGAIAGTLTIMVGGEETAFQKILPLLQVLGKKITYIGASGAGQIAKACNQIMVAAQMTAMAEALVLAQKSGVDPARVVEAIREGAARCWALDTKPPRLLQRELSPGFKSHMQLKDLNIVLETGKAEGIQLPLTAVSQQLYHLMQMAGAGELDNSAVLLMVEALADLQVGNG